MRGGCSPNLVNDSSVGRVIRLHNTVQHNTLSVRNDLMQYVGASKYVVSHNASFVRMKSSLVQQIFGVCVLGHL